jgi:hypothetical protein
LPHEPYLSEYHSKNHQLNIDASKVLETLKFDDEDEEKETVAE